MSPKSPGRSRPDHIHVFGDVAELNLVYRQTKLPDHERAAIAPYRKIRGFVKRKLRGGAWALAEAVKAATGDVWRMEQAAAFGLHSWQFGEDAGGGEHDGWQLWGEVSHGESLWLTATTHFRNFSNNQFNPSDFPPQLSETPTHDDHAAESPAGPVVETLAELPPETANDFGRRANAEVGAADTDPTTNTDFRESEGFGDSGGRRAFRDSINLNSRDSSPISFLSLPIPTDTSNDPSEQATRCNFSGGVLDVTISKDQACQMELLALQSSVLCMMPPGCRVKTAIRFVESDLVLNLLEGADNIETAWNKLSDDERLPLEAFLKIRETAAEEGNSGSSVCRAVALVSNDWEDNPRRKDCIVGCVVIQIGHENPEWKIWSPGQVELNIYSSENQTHLVRSERLKFSFFGEGDLNEERLVAVPLSHRLLHLLNVRKRPAPTINSPIALVSGVYCSWEAGAEYEVPKPTWQVDEFSGTFRLKSAEGYEDSQHYIARYHEVCETDSHADCDDFDTSQKIELGLASSYNHGVLLPEWIPDDVIDGESFKNITFIDLNFGFRKFVPEFKLNSALSGEKLIRVFEGVEQLPPTEGLTIPDWWIPLQKWCSNSNPGWIVGVFGRELPLSRTQENEWDWDDIWHVLRKAHNGALCAKTVAIVSGQLLRASGARISHRLSWEHTAEDCVRELFDNPRFKPLTEFGHLIVRFGCAGALYISKHSHGDAGTAAGRRLFYDATALNSFFRDKRQDGFVLGNNSVFAARVLQGLTGAEVMTSHADVISEAIKKSIADCQHLHSQGFGTRFHEEDDEWIDALPLDQVLFDDYFSDATEV